MALIGKLRDFLNTLELKELASKLDPYITHPTVIGTGTGDMTKAIYDPDDDGLITPEAHTHTESEIMDLQSYVVDAGYVHTDNNFTDAFEAKLNGMEFSGFSKITVGTTEPVAPNVNDIWIDTN